MEEYFGIILLVIAVIAYLVCKNTLGKRTCPLTLKDLNDGGNDSTHDILEWARGLLGDPSILFTVLETDGKWCVFTDYGMIIKDVGVIPYCAIQSITTPQMIQNPSDKNSGWRRASNITLKDGRTISFNYLNIRGNVFSGLIYGIQTTGVPRAGVEYVDNDAVLAN